MSIRSFKQGHESARFPAFRLEFLVLVLWAACWAGNCSQVARAQEPASFTSYSLRSRELLFPSPTFLRSIPAVESRLDAGSAPYVYQYQSCREASPREWLFPVISALWNCNLSALNRRYSIYLVTGVGETVIGALALYGGIAFLTADAEGHSGLVVGLARSLGWMLTAIGAVFLPMGLYFSITSTRCLIQMGGAELHLPPDRRYVPRPALTLTLRF